MPVHVDRNTNGITPGFANPVLQSQTAFRLIMAALAKPGIWHELAGEVAPPPGLPLAAAVTLLTLADFETPVWLPPALRSDGAGAWLKFHCNCPLTEQPAVAAFAFVDGGDDTMPQLDAFAIGDDRFPDRSATVIVQCAARDGGLPVTLSGPGIATTRCVAPSGLRPGFWREAITNAGRYPLGLDLLLIDTTHMMGLPRSTRIEEGA